MSGKSMHITMKVRAACLLLAALLPVSALAASAKALDDWLSQDGLQKTKVKGIELAYVRPGASLASYTRVKLDPIDVEFHEAWNPKKRGSSFGLSTEQREHIRSGVAQIVHEAFVAELQKNNYQIVTDAGPDVLRVEAHIVNLYVTAPDTNDGPRGGTWVVSAGEMTIVSELLDSRTGQALARFVDRQEARDTGRMQLSNSVVNTDEARAIAARWARILRKALDKAHDVGKR